MTTNQQNQNHRDRDFPWPLLAIPFLFIGVFIGTQIGKEEKVREQPVSQPGSVACDGVYFTPGRHASTCTIFNRRGVKLGQVSVSSHTPYCGVMAGFVKCADDTGAPVAVSASAMCPFEGDTPTCPTAVPGAQVEVLRE